MKTAAQVHILLVSEQAAANLLPALDPAMKPAEAVLIVSQKMAQRAKALNAVLSEAQVRTLQVALDDEHSLDALEDALISVAGTLDGKTVALNLTGGTKLMALAAQAVAAAAEWRCFYVDVDTDSVLWLDKPRVSQSLSQQLRLRHYLRGYGFDLTQGIARPQPSAAWQALSQDLVVNFGSLDSAIGSLNRLSQEAVSTLQATLPERERNNPGVDAVLRKFKDAQILLRAGDSVKFDSETARQFANGGWIEHHVFQTVCKVSADLGIRDKAANLQVSDEGGQPNEMDVCFLARNRLFVIECKTARMDRSDGKANDTLYKLAENCRRIGGIGAHAMLVSYRPLSAAEMRLAKALHIELVMARDLARLDEFLKRWVRR